MSPVRIEEFPVACATEATKIYQYLVGQRQVERGNKLDTLILAHPAEFSHIRERCRNNDELRFDVVDMVQLADKAGLKTTPPDSHAEPLLLHTLLRKTPAVQLAPEAERRFFRLWQWRTALNSLAGLILVSCLLFAGKNYLQSYNLQQEIAGHQGGRESRQSSAMKQCSRPCRPCRSPPTNVRAMVARFDEVEKHSPALQATLSQISRALERHAQVEMQQVTGKLPTTFRCRQAAKPVAGAPLMSSGSGVFFVITSIDAQLPVSMLNDHRAILSEVDQFVDELKKKDGVTVIVQHMPFDLASGKTIKSSADTATSQAEAPKFSFRLIQGL